VAVWLSRNALVLVNGLYQAWLVLRSITVGKPFWHITSHTDQFSLDIPWTTIGKAA